MADDAQDVGLGKDLVFAGDTLRLDFAVVTGGTAGGVSAAEWGVFDRQPSPTDASQTALVSKTLGDGITLADGVPGTVIVSVVADPADTETIPGLHYHELKLTVSGDVVHVARGKIHLQHSAL